MLRTGVILRNKYRILHTLGKRGLSGHTYLAEDIEQGTNYAIKELNPRDPENYLELCARFRAEADYLRRLDGFNGQIPKFYESFTGRDGEDVDREYIVQEYIEGKTLAQFAQDMKAHGWTMSESQVKEILSHLLTVVSHIHQEGFIHRDIKPENIILREPDRVPVLIDYGAVKEYELTLIRKGSFQTDFVGTPPYSDEDQLNGKPTAASDLYALGVVAVYLLTKMSPQAIRKKDGKLLWDDLVLGLSRDFSHVIDKAIEPRSSFPGQRFGSAEAMLAALNQVASTDELEEELTRLATRQSRDAAAKGFVKCRECTWHLAVDDRNCVNCGAYNIHCLTEDEAYLFNKSPGKYVEYVKDAFLTRGSKTTSLLKLNQDEYNLITNPIDVYIRKHTTFLADKIPGYLYLSKPTNLIKGKPDLASDASGILLSIPGERPFRISLGEYLEAHRNLVGSLAVAGWICAGLGVSIFGSISILEEKKMSLFFSPCVVIIVVLLAASTYSYVWKLLDSIISFLLLDKKDSTVRLGKFRRLKQSEQAACKQGYKPTPRPERKIWKDKCKQTPMLIEWLDFV